MRAATLLRDVLAASGYEAALARAGDSDPFLTVRRLPEGRVRDLTSLLHAGEPLRLDAAERALGRETLAALVESELVAIDGRTAQAVIRVSPTDGLLLAHDPPGSLGPAHVTGVNRAARTLAALTARAPVERALDVGMGCGYQALLAARHAERVVATDVNPRALSLTAFNAELNAVQGIELREGSFFEPLAGERFGLVVCNPPFVVSPETSYVFRDGGLTGDDVSRIALEGAIGVLGSPGSASILCNWVVRAGEEWETAARRSLHATDADALLVHYGDDDALAYAATWNTHLRADAARFAETLDRWAAHHASLGAERVANVATILRRPGRGRVRSIRASRPPSGDASAHVARLLDPPEDGAFAESVLRPPPHHLEQTLRHDGTSYSAAESLLVPDDGVGAVGTVPPDALHVLLALDGSRTVREAAEIAAETAARPVDDVLAAAEPPLRALADSGLLCRATGR